MKDRGWEKEISSDPFPMIIKRRFSGVSPCTYPSLALCGRIRDGPVFLDYMYLKMDNHVWVESI